MKRFGVFNRGLRRLTLLGEFVGGEIVAAVIAVPAGLDATLGWGRRKYSRKARKVAADNNIPFICIEDGFLRSVGLGSQEPPLSIVVDDVGIYYDATKPSRIEQLIPKTLSITEADRAAALISAWRAARVSKYNHLREYQGDLPDRYVLVVDQTFGDASISYGLADGKSFQKMLDAAIAEHPDSTVLVKIHPDVFADSKKGYFDLKLLAGMPRVQVLAEDVHPVRLIEHAEALYVVTSQMGFEGLLWDKPVRSFGMPFYAGWGLTNDELSVPQRRTPVTLEQLVYAALVDYPRYIDPEGGKRCDPEHLIEWMGLQRRMRERFPLQIAAIGFSGWKKPIVRSYFQGSSVAFVHSAHQTGNAKLVAVWGHKAFSGKLSDDLNLIRLEDGFLRSVGLGADLIAPVSWIMDLTGIYFDATQPSDIETLLQSTDFEDALITRAASLRKRLVATGLTKYNVGAGSWQRPETGRVILVPGQVESDASLAYGAPGIKTNIGLLRAVRAANPEAWLVYKPHPDVLAGMRAQGRDESMALQWCDEQVTDVAMGELLALVDEVHTMTSLAGFEALLRGKKVVCYGQPFYCGWGLTYDFMPLARRSRSLAIDELVAGVLILYPAYVSRATGRFTTPERALDELLSWREQKPGTVSLLKRLKRMLLRKVVGVR